MLLSRRLIYRKIGKWKVRRFESVVDSSLLLIETRSRPTPGRPKVAFSFLTFFLALTSTIIYCKMVTC